jgi:hypothetical protein
MTCARGVLLLQRLRRLRKLAAALVALAGVFRVTLLVAVLVASAGCAASERPSSVRVISEEDVKPFLRWMRWGIWEYEPLASPAELAERADVVVTGRIDAVEEGQAYAGAPESEPEFVTSVIRVHVTEVLRGDGSLVEHGFVYIEVPHPAFVGPGTPGPDGEGGGPLVPFPLDEFAGTVPIGMDGMFFLGDRTNEPYSETILHEGAGRPAGAPITAAHRQGFLIEGVGVGLISVFEPLASMPAGWRGLDSLAAVRATLG